MPGQAARYATNREITTTRTEHVATPDKIVPLDPEDVPVHRRTYRKVGIVAVEFVPSHAGWCAATEANSLPSTEWLLCTRLYT